MGNSQLVTRSEEHERNPYFPRPSRHQVPHESPVTRHELPDTPSPDALIPDDPKLEGVPDLFRRAKQMLVRREKSVSRVFFFNVGDQQFPATWQQRPVDFGPANH